MAEQSLMGCLFFSFIIVASGLAAYLYLLVCTSRQLRKNQKLIESQKKVSSSLNKEIDKKKAEVKDLSKQAAKADVKELAKSLKEEQSKNQELEKKVKSLGNKAKAKPRIPQLIKKIASQARKTSKSPEEIKQKYPSLPKNQLERIEIERSIARTLVSNNGGSFHVSQILRFIEDLYPKHIRPNDRIMLLNEIKSWIERDPLCNSVSTTSGVQHYTFI